MVEPPPSTESPVPTPGVLLSAAKPCFIPESQWLIRIGPSASVRLARRAESPKCDSLGWSEPASGGPVYLSLIS